VVNITCDAAPPCDAPPAPPGAPGASTEALVGGALVAVIVAPITAVLVIVIVIVAVVCCCRKKKEARATGSADVASAASSRYRARTTPTHTAQQSQPERGAPSIELEDVAMTGSTVMPGQQVTVSDPQGNHFTVTVPQNIQPGMIFYARVPLPTPAALPPRAAAADAGGREAVAAEGVQVQVVPPAPAAAPQPMTITVPDGVAPGQPFLLNTPHGQMQVLCPPGVRAGQPMIINVPTPAAPAADAGERGGVAAAESGR